MSALGLHLYQVHCTTNMRPMWVTTLSKRFTSPWSLQIQISYWWLLLLSLLGSVDSSFSKFWMLALPGTFGLYVFHQDTLFQWSSFHFRALHTISILVNSKRILPALICPLFVITDSLGGVDTQMCNSSFNGWNFSSFLQVLHPETCSFQLIAIPGIPDPRTNAESSSLLTSWPTSNHYGNSIPWFSV